MADSETKEQKKAAKAQAKADKKAEKQQAKDDKAKSKGAKVQPFSAGRRMLSMLYWLIMISVLVALGWQGFVAYELFSGSK